MTGDVSQLTEFRQRLQQLLDESHALSGGYGEFDKMSDPGNTGPAGAAWLTSAGHIVSVLIPNAENPYRKRFDALADE